MVFFSKLYMHAIITQQQSQLKEKFPFLINPIMYVYMYNSYILSKWVNLIPNHMLKSARNPFVT